ncbi:MAG: Ig-like domain-containing protein [Anaerolineales bacterium]
MKTKTRFAPVLNCLLLVSLILTSCSGLRAQATPTAIPPTLTSQQQTAPPALVETDPPLDSVIGYLSPITFYFNQPMNPSTVESAFSGLPAGAYVWKDASTLFYTPAQPYPPNSKLKITIGSSIQSATGFGIDEPIELSFTVSDLLRATNRLPKSGATDSDVNAAIVASFNQPVVPLGDSENPPSAFNVQPSVAGRGEWINTSTYIFYPESAMSGGTEYTVSLNPGLKTVAGVPLDGSGENAWKFVTANPRVVTLDPTADKPIGPDAKITLTFNQPMDAESVQSNFLLSGVNGPVSGSFAWNNEGTELIFTPDNDLARGVGYLLKVDADAQSSGGATLGKEFGAALNVYPDFAVTKATPYQTYVEFQFSAPLIEGDYVNSVTVTPSVSNLQAGVYDYGDGPMMSLYGAFQPETDYTIALAGSIKDQWGESLGESFVLNFTTPPLPASLTFQSFYNAAFVRPDAPVLHAGAINIQTVDVGVEPLALQDFFTLQSSYDALRAYQPKNAVFQSQTFDLPRSVFQPVSLNLTAENSPLPPGVYYVEIKSPQLQSQQGTTLVPARARDENPAPNSGGGGSVGLSFVVSSQVNLTFKHSAKEALVWAVDLSSQTPVKGAPVVIYDGGGNAIGSGTTDSNGIWKGAINPYEGAIYAVLGAPGEETFGLAVSEWNSGLAAWNFGYSQIVQPPTTQIYLYTDRPIYRPGQTVYFRGAARQAFNGRYELAPLTEINFDVTDGAGVLLSTINASLSPYGTFNGEVKLAEDAAPGYYTIQNPSLSFYFGFQVAEYRKPEINLNVEFPTTEIKRGDAASATVNAQYFFGAPAGNVDATWSMFTQPSYFYLPGYQTGLIDTNWYSTSMPQTDLETGGDEKGKTDAQGKLSIPLPAVPASEEPQTVMLEVTVLDESGFPISARSELVVHPADFYIGLRSDSWIGKANEAMGFDVVTTDWAKNPSGDHTLAAEFKQVSWERETSEFGQIIYKPVYTPVSSSNLATGPDGRARLSFVPPNAGTFMLDVSGGNPSTGSVRSQLLIWVGGPGTAAWPQLDNNKIQLTAGKDSYNPGDTATVFIPNPFATDSLALVTVERGIVFSSELITLSGSGDEYSFDVTEEDAPNVYVTVTVLNENDFRHGIVNIPVAADALKLNVQVTPNPAQAGPRDEVTLDVLVTDHQGQPVQGEFSLAVVDRAVLALADPNSPDIFTEFYSNQPLGIETSVSLSALSKAGGPPGGGLGGGGGGEGEIPSVREEFPDTAYWNPALVTDAEGRGQVTMTLPDSLTTWNIDARGLTVDTKVGQAETQIVSTKPLLIRPVTPRFLVGNDHALMAAVVNNNTSDALTVTVSLQSEGFVLDEPDKASQQIDVPANGRARVEWWGTASLAKSADLIFTAKADDSPLEDSTRPVWGTLPILQYTSPQTFVTGGALRGAATQQEVISLPRTFAPTSGGLEVELSPSLAGSLTSALEAMPKPDQNSAEDIVSFIVPNAEVYRALNGAGLNDPKLVERVEANLNSSVSRIFYLQNSDGGWGWWGNSGESNPYISAYVFFGLLRAREAGAAMNEDALQRAGTYLRTLKPSNTTDTEVLDKSAFVQFALAHAGTFNDANINQLYDARDRMSPAGKAWLAFAINKFSSTDSRARDLISNLESSAILTSSSAHWESSEADFFTRDSTIFTTSAVVYALAQVDPANQILPNAVRYLAAHRNSNKLWNIGHDNAWAILALNAAMVGMGEVRADFAYDAKLNGNPLTNGDIAGIQVTPITATVPLEFLSPNSPNLLTIHREDGLGRLYYNATLQLNRPVQDVQPLDKGMQIDRVYCVSNETRAKSKDCSPLSSIQADANRQFTAQLTLTLPHDAYNVMIEDFIPAGTEILDQNLNTSQQAVDATGVQVQFDDANPFNDGWGWWLFNPPQIRDDGILFTADYLPAGTYVLTYTLIPLQAGEYRVLPAHAWQAFFPEVQGTSAGAVFEIKP